MPRDDMRGYYMNLGRGPTGLHDIFGNPTWRQPDNYHLEYAFRVATDNKLPWYSSKNPTHHFLLPQGPIYIGNYRTVPRRQPYITDVNTSHHSPEAQPNSIPQAVLEFSTPLGLAPGSIAQNPVHNVSGILAPSPVITSITSAGQASVASNQLDTEDEQEQKSSQNPENLSIVDQVPSFSHPPAQAPRYPLPPKATSLLSPYPRPAYDCPRECDSTARPQKIGHPPPWPAQSRVQENKTTSDRTTDPYDLRLIDPQLLTMDGLRVDNLRRHHVPDDQTQDDVSTVVAGSSTKVPINSLSGEVPKDARMKGDRAQFEAEVLDMLGLNKVDGDEARAEVAYAESETAEWDLGSMDDGVFLPPDWEDEIGEQPPVAAHAEKLETSKEDDLFVGQNTGQPKHNRFSNGSMLMIDVQRSHGLPVEPSESAAARELSTAQVELISRQSQITEARARSLWNQLATLRSVDTTDLDPKIVQSLNPTGMRISGKKVPIERPSSPGPYYPIFDDPDDPARIPLSHPFAPVGGPTLANIPLGRIWEHGHQGCGSCDMPREPGVPCGQDTPGICESTEHHPGERVRVCGPCDATNRTLLLDAVFRLDLTYKMRAFTCWSCARSIDQNPAMRLAGMGQRVFDVRIRRNYDPEVIVVTAADGASREQHQHQQHQQQQPPPAGSAVVMTYGGVFPEMVFTGCSCGAKLFERRLCHAHRLQGLAELAGRVQSMRAYATRRGLGDLCFVCGDEKPMSSYGFQGEKGAEGKPKVWGCLCCGGIVIGVEDGRGWVGGVATAEAFEE
ncbi:hypothetical protein BX600DRAFT_520033 [Xylariales sp. PMI_506]|nr:hypothetical protein BX600DRAFT_520033 [Xylariales sp. PMI_506]